MCATYIYIFMLGYNHHHINDDDAGQMMTKKLSVKAVPRRRTLLRTPEGGYQPTTLHDHALQAVWKCENLKEWKCENLKEWACERVKVWKFERVSVWNSESVKIWKSESMKEWKCERLSKTEGSYHVLLQQVAKHTVKENISQCIHNL